MEYDKYLASTSFQGILDNLVSYLRVPISIKLKLLKYNLQQTADPKSS